MTKQITVTLEENLIETMQDYFDTLAVTQTVQDYKMKIMKPISHKNIKALLSL